MPPQIARYKTDLDLLKTKHSLRILHHTDSLTQVVRMKQNDKTVLNIWTWKIILKKMKEYVCKNKPSKTVIKTKSIKEIVNKHIKHQWEVFSWYTYYIKLNLFKSVRQPFITLNYKKEIMHIFSLLKKCIWVITKEKQNKTNPNIKEMGVIAE